jgi:hypothetical protein
MKKRAIPFLLVLIGCLMIFSSCSPSNVSNEDKMAAYLNVVGPDFQQSKDELSVFDQQVGQDNADVAEVLTLVNQGKSDFQARLENA